MTALFSREPSVWKASGMILIASTGLVVIFLTVSALYGYRYRGTIFPGVTVMQINLAGLTRDQAIQRVEDVMLTRSAMLRFRIGQKDLFLSPANRYLKTNTNDVIDRALRMGRKKTLIANFFERARLLVAPTELLLAVTLDRDAAERALTGQIQDRLSHPQDAKLLIFMKDGDKTPSVSIEPERIGRLIDISQGLDALQDQINQLDFRPIILRETEVLPLFRTQEAARLAEQVPDWISHAPFFLTADERTWKVTPAILAGWTSVTTTEKGTVLAFDPERVSMALRDWAKGILQEPRDGKLVVEDGVLKTFEAPQAGLRIDPNRVIEKILDGWIHNSSTIDLPLETIMPIMEGEDAETLGIRERIGFGKSNFNGSPINRRKNIAKGASLLHGVLIAPGENFSLLKALGTIDGPHGWFPELVIKGNKTTPEYGGGLCQIGTTVFRTALNTGLPITERRNHSYRVRYYEPAGTDATIYDPSPDFRFLNDTGKWILLTTHNSGNDLTFTMWGTKDGRTVHLDKPKIFNITSAPPQKNLDSTDIPVGTTKCTETAHPGATASLAYAVTYADGQTSSTTFISHYKPWGAVCLHGVAPTSTAQ